ncbi:hypothetical protein [Desulfonatronospira sp. MSAO_Bac3]|uniref:homocitrate synthase/isopropylmalate synthase family protein n=1 Tax=Desulfonatronospira sp. MSAO_Bac3 TaxID=2293857 RepID=UPI000FF8206D|nr:hypothetical protein [Desulfonatronospira sp. MSAO_Bac3]RQD77611.1 MAG: hypothetical protein D5S03_03995 [Desulfonatronospira sp. MSAO_Bac3]
MLTLKLGPCTDDIEGSRVIRAVLRHALCKKVFMLIDTTLREGDQRYGLYLSLEQKKVIVDGLHRLGLDELETGSVGRDEELETLIKYARQHHGSTKISLWSPCRIQELEYADSLDPDIISAALPVSDLHIEKRLGLDRCGALRLLERTLAGTDKLKAKLSLGLEDFSRADREFALRAALMARDLGVWRVRLSDTLGVMEPGELMEAVRPFREKLDISLAFHGHNDFGMATANALTALSCGVDYVDVSLLGIGERAGIARLEEVLTFLVYNKGHAGYDVQSLPELSTCVAGLAGVHINPDRAVLGRQLFHCESGLHADALYKSFDLFEPFEPHKMGMQRRISLGRKSGAGAVRGKLMEMGVNPDFVDLEGLVRDVRRAASIKGSPLDDEQVVSMLQGQAG